MDFEVGDKVIRKSSPQIGIVERFIAGSPRAEYPGHRYDRAGIRWDVQRWWGTETTRSTVRLSDLLPATPENVANVAALAQKRAVVRQANFEKKVAELRRQREQKQAAGG